MTTVDVRSAFHATAELAHAALAGTREAVAVVNTKRANLLAVATEIAPKLSQQGHHSHWAGYLMQKIDRALAATTPSAARDAAQDLRVLSTNVYNKLDEATLRDLAFNRITNGADAINTELYRAGHSQDVVSGLVDALAHQATLPEAEVTGLKELLGAGVLTAQGLDDASTALTHLIEHGPARVVSSAA